MRIIAGKWRSRRLKAPPGDATRPTTDRVREALFQHLVSARFGSFDGLHVLDLFAGAGTLGLEALSRGAAALTSIEADRRAAAVIRDNVAALGAHDVVELRVRRLPAELGRLPPAHYDLIFADPPYAMEIDSAFASALAPCARPGALLVHEHAARTRPVLGPCWQDVDRRTYGDTVVTLAERTGASTDPG